MQKRKDMRYNSNSCITVLDRKANRPIGRLVDLSKNGAMILTAESVKISSKLSCKIELKKPIMECYEIWFEATCCWSRKNIGNDSWESGFQLETSGIDRELIAYLQLSFVMDNLEHPNIDEFKIVPLENRRSSTRYAPKDYFPVFEKNSSAQIGDIIDISLGGAKMITNLIHEIDSIVEYRAKLPKRIFQRDYLIFKAKCQWLKKDDMAENYEIGLKFVNLSQQDSVIILHLIIHYMEELPSIARVKVI